MSTGHENGGWMNDDQRSAVKADAERKERSIVAAETAGAKTPQRMLYEVCSVCNGTGWHPSALDKLCVCKKLHVVEIGLTVGQAEYMANLDTLRQEAGISAAMLRDGRASAFRDMLAALKTVVKVAQRSSTEDHFGENVSEVLPQIIAAIAKAEGGKE